MGYVHKVTLRKHVNFVYAAAGSTRTYCICISKKMYLFMIMIMAYLALGYLLKNSDKNAVLKTK